MEKNIVSSRQVSCIMIMFILGSSLVTGTGQAAKQDSWISVIISTFMAIPLVLIYARLSKLFPGKNLYDIVYESFGKIGGLIISLIYIFYSLQLGSLVVRNFTEFIQIESLPQTPQFIIAMFMGTICFWTLKHGLEVLCRGCVIVLPIVILVIIFTTVFMVKDMNLNNIKPIFGTGFKNILSGSFSVLMYPFGEVVMFIMVLSSLQPKDSPYKVYLSGTIIGGILLVSAVLRNLLVLGEDTSHLLYFSSYSAVSVLSLGNFITRIEIVVAANFLIAGLVKISICLYSSSVGIAKIFKIDNYKLIVVPIAFFIIAFSQLIYTNAMQMFEFVKIYNYYATIFQIILPVIILIFAEIKVRKNKKIAKCEAGY